MEKEPIFVPLSDDVIQENTRSPEPLEVLGHITSLSTDPGESYHHRSTSKFPFIPCKNPSTLPDYHELKETDSSLNEVLDSLIPYLRDPSVTVPLPVFLGNSVYKNMSLDGEAIISRQDGVGNRKEFSWSRGLGIGYSPIKPKVLERSV